MFVANTIKVPRLSTHQLVTGILLLLYVALAVVALQSYIQWQSVNVLLGLIALPIVTIFRQPVTYSRRYAWGALLFAGLTLVLPVNTLLYFAIVFAVFFVIETRVGKLNGLPLLVAGLMSPIFQFAVNVFSFPIRLQLTEWAGACLRLTGGQTDTNGNMIMSRDSEFSVDPACMGLSMMVTSLLIGVLLIAINQKRYQLTWRWWMMVLFAIIIVALNVCCNLVRIVSLVQFHILPGTFMHELTGIICFLVYVVLPVTILSKWATKRFGRNEWLPRGRVIFSQIPSTSLHMILLLAMLVAGLNIEKTKRNEQDTSGPVATIPGFRATRVSSDIIKLENEKVLVYIKGIPGFYSGEHNPMICWRGSGYALEQTAEKTINGMQVYTAVLRNRNDELYTAWWYDCGSKRTNSQLAWRWDMLKNGLHYSVVNVTAISPEELTIQMERIQREDLFQKLF